MFREVAITLVALAAFDYFYLDGKYPLVALDSWAVQAGAQITSGRGSEG
jgi:hypothetical protein